MTSAGRVVFVENEMIDIVPLNPHVGAEVRGLDLAREIEPSVAAELYAAWLRHHVLVFRGQALTADDQRRFTLLFGEIQPPRSRPGQRDPNNPVLYIGNATIDGQRGELPEGDMQFHADQCYYENPAKGAVLYALEIPSRGGNTLFASTGAAYDSLPEELRCRCCSFMITKRTRTGRRRQIGREHRAMSIRRSCSIRKRVGELFWSIA